MAKRKSKTKKIVRKKKTSDRKTSKKKDSKDDDPRILWAGWQAVPLKGSFMVFAILGFLITAYLIYPISSDFGIALMLVFTVMFLASLVSITKAPIKNK